MLKDGESSPPVVIPWKDVPCDLHPYDSSVSEEAMHEVWEMVLERDVNIPSPQIWTYQYKTEHATNKYGHISTRLNMQQTICHVFFELSRIWTVWWCSSCQQKFMEFSILNLFSILPTAMMRHSETTYLYKNLTSKTDMEKLFNLSKTGYHFISEKQFILCLHQIWWNKTIIKKSTRQNR